MNQSDSFIYMSEAERVLFRLRSLHRERVEAIHKGESHVPLNDSTRLVVHLLPEEAVCATKTFSVAELKRASPSIRPLGERNGYSYGQSRFNADGLLLWDGRETARSYSQLYRNGVCEGVMAEAVFQHNQAKLLRENWCEEALLAVLAGYLGFGKTLGLEPPFWMFAALEGCEGGEGACQPCLGGTFAVRRRPQYRLVAGDEDRRLRHRPREALAPGARRAVECCWIGAVIQLRRAGKSQAEAVVQKDSSSSTTRGAVSSTSATSTGAWTAA